MKKYKWSFFLALILVFALAANSAPQTLAFSDISGDPGQSSIETLQRQGFINGIDANHFAPRANLSYAQAVSLLVRSFGLSLDTVDVEGEPKASDYFAEIDDDAWYAEAYLIAHLNGLPINKDVDPNAALSREQYADLLAHAIATTGEYAYILIFILLADEDQVDPAYMGSIQQLIISGIVSLDADQNFLPKGLITRSEAAVWLHKSLEFVEEMNSITPEPVEPVEPEEIDVIISPINEEVNQVILDRGPMPHPGYGISVASIEFTEDTAWISYRLIEPDPDRMYPMVITEVSITTYVSSEYKIEIQQIFE